MGLSTRSTSKSSNTLLANAFSLKSHPSSMSPPSAEDPQFPYLPHPPQEASAHPAKHASSAMPKTHHAPATVAPALESLSFPSLPTVKERPMISSKDCSMRT